MKAFSESARKQFDAAGLILLFDGEVVPLGGTDEHSQTGILTSDLTSFPPSRPLMHKPDSGFWELVIRYSGATVPDSHGVPWI